MAFVKLSQAGKHTPGSWYYEPGDSFYFAAPSINPQHVAVLTGPRTASSAEIFVMDAKQSTKVTVFGTTTAGVVDYGDGTNFYIGCDSIIVNIPTRKSEYLNKNIHYDNRGIQPAVPINYYELDPYRLIMDYFRKQR